jgi:hypothetical protein
MACILSTWSHFYCKALASARWLVTFTHWVENRYNDSQRVRLLRNANYRRGAWSQTVAVADSRFVFDSERLINPF